jgi:hypothetical protein
MMNKIKNKLHRVWQRIRNKNMCEDKTCATCTYYSCMAKRCCHKRYRPTNLDFNIGGYGVAPTHKACKYHSVSISSTI